VGDDEGHQPARVVLTEREPVVTHEVLLLAQNTKDKEEGEKGDVLLRDGCVTKVERWLLMPWQEVPAQGQQGAVALWLAVASATMPEEQFASWKRHTQKKPTCQRDEERRSGERPGHVLEVLGQGVDGVSRVGSRRVVEVDQRLRVGLPAA
jgi:hypothetical protein